MSKVYIPDSRFIAVGFCRLSVFRRVQRPSAWRFPSIFANSHTRAFVLAVFVSTVFVRCRFCARRIFQKQSSNEAVNADRSKLRKNPKVLPFMAAGKEGEKTAPLWDPRMVSGWCLRPNLFSAKCWQHT